MIRASGWGLRPHLESALTQNTINWAMFEQRIKNIDGVPRKEAGCSSELDYTEQSSWMLFLTYLDYLEQEGAIEAELEGRSYTYIIDEPHR